MVRLTGNMATNAGVAISGGTAIYFPTSVNATEATAAGCGTADTSNSSGVFQCLALAANTYDIRVNCGSAFRWFRYADEIQHATYQTGDSTDDTEGNVFFGIGNDAGLRWSTSDASNHAFVVGVGDTSQQLHITDRSAMNTDWVRAAGTHPELAIHSNTSPACDYLALGNHDGTTASIDVVGGTTLALAIAGNTELTVTASGLNVPANSDILFTGTTGTNDINLVDSVADALSIVRGSTDVIVFDTSTPRVTITPATTITGLITATGGITLPANADIAMTGTTGTNDIVLTNCLADALSITDGSADVMVFDTNTAGNVITMTASLNVTIPDDDTASVDIANSATSYYVINTANTATGTVAHLFDTEDPTIASATGAVYTLMSVPAATYTFTGSTQMTSLQEAVSIVGPTLATDAVGLTIDKASTLSLTAPIEGTAGGGTTLTAASALRMLNTSGTPTTQYGLFIEDLTAGATSDYGIWLAGADTAAIVIASADPLQLGIAGTATGTMNWQGATSGTVNMTVAAAAGCWTLILPVDNGTACQFLQTDGCGVTSWAAGGGGVTLSGSTNNRMVTVTGSNALTEEANITYCGVTFSHSASSASSVISSLQNTENTNSAADASFIMRSGGSSGGDPQILIGISAVVCGHIGLDNSACDQMTLSADSGAPGAGDAIRIVAAQCVTFDAPACYTTFDYVCEECGWHGANYTAICPMCGGLVDWHDDVLVVRSLSQLDTRRAALQQLDKIGVMTLSANHDGTPWVGINMQRAMLFTWSGLHQNRQLIDNDYCCLNTRLKKLEEKLEVPRA